MNNILDGKTGSLFPPTSKFVGQVAFFAGLIAMIMTPLAGFFFMAVGAFVGYGKEGILLNPATETYKDYTSVFGMRFGKDKSYAAYPFLSVMRTKVTSGAFSMSNRHATTGSNLYYDVYFLSETHREKVLIRRFTNQHDAKESARELGELLTKDVVMYSPVVSEATRRRR